jgi:hypothetical protein
MNYDLGCQAKRSSYESVIIKSMGDLVKKFSSLILAVIVVLAILFLPDAKLQFITSSVKYIARFESTSQTLANFLLNSTVKGLAILSVTAIFSYLAHWVYRRGLK